MGEMDGRIHLERVGKTVEVRKLTGRKKQLGQHSDKSANHRRQLAGLTSIRNATLRNVINLAERVHT